MKFIFLNRNICNTMADKMLMNNDSLKTLKTCNSSIYKDYVENCSTIIQEIDTQTFPKFLTTKLCNLMFIISVLYSIINIQYAMTIMMYVIIAQLILNVALFVSIKVSDNTILKCANELKQSPSFPFEEIFNSETFRKVKKKKKK